MGDYEESDTSSSSSSDEYDNGLDLTSINDSNLFNSAAALTTTVLTDDLDLPEAPAWANQTPSTSFKTRNTARKSTTQNPALRANLTQVHKSTSSRTSTRSDVHSGTIPERAAASAARRNIKTVVSSDSEDDSDADSNYDVSDRELQTDESDVEDEGFSKRTNRQYTHHQVPRTKPCTVILIDIVEKLKRLSAAGNSVSTSRVKAEPVEPQDIEVKLEEPAKPVSVTSLNIKRIPALAFKCDDCDAQMLKEEDFKRHRQMHINKDRFRCIKCSFSAPQQWQLNNHIKFDHKRPVATANPIIKDGGNFRCKDCEFVTSEEAAMKRHAHHHTDKKNNTCLHCSYSASASWMINDHLKTGHKSLLQKQEAMDKEAGTEKAPDKIEQEKLAKEQAQLKEKQDRLDQLKRVIEQQQKDVEDKERELKRKQDLLGNNVPMERHSSGTTERSMSRERKKKKKSNRRRHSSSSSSTSRSRSSTPVKKRGSRSRSNTPAKRKERRSRYRRRSSESSVHSEQKKKSKKKRKSSSHSSSPNRKEDISFPSSPTPTVTKTSKKTTTKIKTYRSKTRPSYNEKPDNLQTSSKVIASKKSKRTSSSRQLSPSGQSSSRTSVSAVSKITCVTCKKSFDAESDVRKHGRAFTKHTLKCKGCGFAHRDTKNLINHVSSQCVALKRL